MSARLGINGPVSIATVADMVAIGAVDECQVYADFEISDEPGGDGPFCLWILWHSSLAMPTLEFIGPTYRELQAMWAREVEARKIGVSTKRPATRDEAARTRRNAL